MLEFTGERVVPGQVDADLWNEHLARYLFAARLVARRRVLDLGCGTGYGAAELARSAQSVHGIDPSLEAIELARSAYPADNLSFSVATATALPFPDASFELITCFEVIEHVADWRALLREARRVLAPGGRFLVSTPNKVYYNQTREVTGPNPFHVHEFEFKEFEQALGAVFPSLDLYLQNHITGLCFQPFPTAAADSVDLHLDSSQTDPSEAHFFLAVCALSAESSPPGFLHVPSTSNVLQERESHIRKLEEEIALKDTWLNQLQSDLSNLVATHSATEEEKERAQAWAQAEHEQFEAARSELLAASERYEQRLAAQEISTKKLLDGKDAERKAAQEWAQQQQAAFEAARSELLAASERYEQRLAANERAASELLNQRFAELHEAQQWALREHEEFEASRRELQAVCQAYEERLAANERAANELLNQRFAELQQAQQWALREHEEREAAQREVQSVVQSYEERLAENASAAEALLAQRTQQLERLQAIISAIRQSRWLRLGRLIRLGPDLKTF